MAKMTLKKWKEIGRICGYDGTRTAATWSKDADRLRKACPYELWKKMASLFKGAAGGSMIQDESGNWYSPSVEEADRLNREHGLGKYKNPPTDSVGDESSLPDGGDNEYIAKMEEIRSFLNGISESTGNKRLKDTIKKMLAYKGPRAINHIPGM